MGKAMLLVLIFIAGAALSWGLYVPTVHAAQMALKSPLRAFLFVGVAYFITAVLVPSLFVFVMNWDPTVKPGVTPNFDLKACMYGLAGGTLGAAGALCIIFAVTIGSTNPGLGDPRLYVPPLVFAGAPIINTIATMLYFNPTKQTPDPRFFLGLIMAAVGAALVMLYKPVGSAHGAPPKTPAASVAPANPETH